MIPVTVIPVTVHSIFNPNHPHPHSHRPLLHPRIQRRQRMSAERGHREVQRVARAQRGTLHVAEASDGAECGLVASRAATAQAF